MTAILLVGGVVYSPGLLLLAAVFGLVTYLLYEHASGRLLDRIYRGVERQAATGGADPERGGFGAGPREEWTPPREEQRRRARRRAGQRARQQRPAGGARDGPTPQEAYGVLGLDPGADENRVREAYRERIKEVHPDTESGDEEEFKRVREAYEVLTE
jgi:predicted outer membrane lipoprotein